jgi:hypothetical protein
MANSAKILRENVDISSINPRDLTTDCYFVYRVDNQVDLARAAGLVHVFDTYHDIGIKLKRIKHAGGYRNPKFQEPQI